MLRQQHREASGIATIATAVLTKYNAAEADSSPAVVPSPGPPRMLESIRGRKYSHARSLAQKPANTAHVRRHSPAQTTDIFVTAPSDQLVLIAHARARTRAVSRSVNNLDAMRSAEIIVPCGSKSMIRSRSSWNKNLEMRGLARCATLTNLVTILLVQGKRQRCLSFLSHMEQAGVARDEEFDPKNRHFLGFSSFQFTTEIVEI